MVTRLAAGLVAGLFALGATPARAQVKDERKPDQAETIKKLEAELAKLRAVEEELKARLERLQVETQRKQQIERVERGTIERKIDDARKQAEIENKRAQAELQRATKLRDEQLQRVENDRVRERDNLGRLVEEVEKVQRLGDEKAKLAQIEREKTVRLRDEQQKFTQLDQERLAKLQEERARLVQREIDRTIELKLAGQDKPRVLVLEGSKGPVAYEKMSAQELKQVITKLQILLDEKVRAAEKENLGGEKIRPGTPDKAKPGLGEKVKPGAVSQDEILKRLDKLTQEVEELKRAIKK